MIERNSRPRKGEFQGTESRDQAIESNLTAELRAQVTECKLAVDSGAVPLENAAMANAERVAILNKGVEAWNVWRAKHPETTDIAAALEGAGVESTVFGRTGLFCEAPACFTSDQISEVRALVFGPVLMNMQAVKITALSRKRYHSAWSMCGRYSVLQDRSDRARHTMDTQRRC